MLQRQIVVKALDTQIDIEDLAYRKYAITDFHSIIWMFIAVIVTIYRNTAASSQRCPISHWMLMTTKLRSSI
jgi:hypothetical protein